MLRKPNGTHRARPPRRAYTKLVVVDDDGRRGGESAGRHVASASSEGSTEDIMIRIIAVLAALGMSLVACGESDEGDASANLACRHFRNIAADVRDNQLTDAELREKLQEVEEDARVSEEPGIPQAGRNLVAAITTNDPEALLEAVSDMDAACDQAGF